MAHSPGQRKIHVIALKIAFLMPHQHVMTDLKELAAQLKPQDISEDVIDHSSPEYLQGAYDALTALITDLERKGS
jgi:hypothetical protein